MTDNVENLILEHLRAIRADIGGIKEDVREIKQRLASLTFEPEPPRDEVHQHVGQI